MRGQHRMISNRSEQAMNAVREDGRHATGVRRDHRETACERFDDGHRHVVDARTLDVDVVRTVRVGNRVGRDRAGERDAAQLEVVGKASQRTLLRTAADQGQRGIGPAVQNKPEGTERASDVIERLEISRREKPGTQWIALAEGKAIQIHDVRHDRRVDAEAGEHVDEKTRRHDVFVDVGQRDARNG